MRTIPTKRVLLAFLLAPWIVPFAFLPYAWIMVLTAPPSIRSALTPLDFTLRPLFLFGPMSILFAYSAELILGLPVWLIFKRGHIESRMSFIATGAGMGLAVHLAISLYVADSVSAALTRFTDPSNAYLYICIAAGALSAGLFHTILFFPRR